MGAAFVLAMGSCAYNPNYAVGGSYSAGYGGDAGYGEGYGYGNSGFSTATFVSTGDSRWGYDPYCNSYYDYRRRCYYDPYLYGYYPVGYRPVIVVGVPHPYGYSRTFCPPPSRVRSLTLTNYNNRAIAYRNSSYSWAHQVHQQSGPVRGQPQLQQHQAPYTRTGNQPYGSTHTMNQVQGGAPGSHNLNNVNPVHGQPGQAPKYTGTMNPKYGPTTQANPQIRTGGPQPQVRTGGPQPQVRTGGPQPQVTHAGPAGSAPASRVRGQGKDGKEERGNAR